MSTPESTLKARALDLKLHGLLSHWEAIKDNSWVSDLIQWEEEERARRSLERRLKGARLGRFKPLADFDWDWPARCDRVQVQELMQLEFLADAVNVILVGPNGVGKSTLARNIAHQAVLNVINLSLTVFFDTASGIRGLGLFSCLSGTCVLGAQLLPHRPYAAITAMRGPVAKFPRKA